MRIPIAYTPERVGVGKVDIFEKIRQGLKRADKPENRLDYQKFFKEKLRDPVGLKTPVLRKISNE